MHEPLELFDAAGLEKKKLFPLSFRWHDYLLESQTSLLTSTEVLDVGIVPDEVDDF